LLFSSRQFYLFFPHRLVLGKYFAITLHVAWIFRGFFWVYQHIIPEIPPQWNFCGTYVGHSVDVVHKRKLTISNFTDISWYFIPLSSTTSGIFFYWFTVEKKSTIPLSDSRICFFVSSTPIARRRGKLAFFQNLAFLVMWLPKKFFFTVLTSIFFYGALLQAQC
jgi:hypothetical protein